MMGLLESAVDALVAALFGVTAPTMAESGVYTPPGGVALAVTAVVRRDDQRRSLGSVGLQRLGARLLLDREAVPTRPREDATLVVGGKTWIIRQARRGSRFWFCEAQAA